uniref:Uncharacterized protein n=1 Tax=Saccharolobus islandicus TaxID=43080 RepID=Q5W2V1_SACIS|nr:hypothetical protein [Sulfolobus islandicus]CAG38195.1 hypothetical protein [Sulfolobus islandicus]
MERVEEEILLFLLKNGAVKDKYLVTYLLKKGFSKYEIMNALEDLYFYGFILKRPTVKRNENVYCLTEKGKMEAELLEEGVDPYANYKFLKKRRGLRIRE